jgi:hypothetical protein
MPDATPFGDFKDRQEISSGASRRQARGGNASYCSAVWII